MAKRCDQYKGNTLPTSGPDIPLPDRSLWEHVFVPDAATSPQSTAFTVAGLFAGIGGLELGFHLAGAHTELLCEVWEPAKTVLTEHFPGVALHGDIGSLGELPATDVVTAGFPCQDLSQAGRTAGIHGQESGLVRYLFKLLSDAQPRWVVIENVRNMLVLDGGNAMRYLITELEKTKLPLGLQTGRFPFHGSTAATPASSAGCLTRRRPKERSIH